MTFGVAGNSTVSGTDAGVYNYYLKNLNFTGQANCCKNGVIMSRVVHGGVDYVTITAVPWNMRLSRRAANTSIPSGASGLAAGTITAPR